MKNIARLLIGLTLVLNFRLSATQSDLQPFYEVSGTSSCHLLGEVHFFRLSTPHLPASLKELWQQSEVVFVEAIHGVTVSGQDEKKLAPIAFSPEAELIRSSAELAKLKTQYISKLSTLRGMDQQWEILQSQMPTVYFSQFLSMMRRIDGQSRNRLGEFSKGYTMQLMEKFPKPNYALKPLENAGTHQMLLNELLATPMNSHNYLRESIELQLHPDTDLIELKLEQAVREGNLIGIEAELDNLTQGRSLVSLDLIEVTKRRTEMWMPALLKFLQSGDRKKCFISVGAQHLTGSQGLLSLLREKGILIRRVTYN